ncbi:efflux RND transporter periplasmic adaptor subunit [Roseivirga sp. BDSF3-8]|uniref:efflux RND transporter periplasmic adaptor subunit n=1 Tax=Roseivirga sp. BDSF3-8 TaxID=3241598 RepID=UPI003531DBD9
MATAKRKKSNKKWYIIGALIVFLVIVLMVAKRQGWIGQPNAREVELAEVRRTTIIQKVTASGTIQPETEVKISPDVPGEIIELNVEEGDSVRQGDLLIRIRPDNFQTALARAEASLNQQRASLAEAQARLSRAEAQKLRAKSEFDRQQALYEDSVISDSDFEQAKTNYLVADQDLEGAKQNVLAANYMVKTALANVSEAKENLSLTSVYAPVTGIVSLLNVEKGERVVGTSQMQGTEMLRIADLSRMEVRVDVNENDIIKVGVGDTAEIDVDSYSFADKQFRGVVTAIANTANQKATDEAVTEFEVKVRILNDSYKDLVAEGNTDAPFRPGMTASVDIVTDVKRNVLAVPLSAVATRTLEDGEVVAAYRESKSKGEVEEVVFIAEGGMADLKIVKTGISDFDNIEVTEGLSEGQEVVSGPFLAVSKELEDGDRISVKEREETTSRRSRRKTGGSEKEEEEQE